MPLHREVRSKMGEGMFGWGSHSGDAYGWGGNTDGVAHG